MDWLFSEMWDVHKAGKPHRSVWALLSIHLVLRHRRILGELAAASSLAETRYHADRLEKNLRRLERASRRAHHPE